MECSKRGKFIAVQSYLSKQEKHQIDSLTLHLKQLEKEQKTRAEINEKEMKETIVNINKTKSFFFEKMNEIGNN